MLTEGPRPGLRTEHGISNVRVVGPSQVIFSSVLFCFIYALLFAVWVYVLNSKIQHGPDAEEGPPTHTSGGGLLEAASSLIASQGESLTRADTPEPKGASRE
jgi:cytochrome d ubiquinol oxidase subunit I